MQKIDRYIKNDIIKKLQPNKVVVLYGPRQVGKTTLVKEILEDVKDKYLFLSGETRSAQGWLSSQEIDTFKQYIGDNKLLVIDEAQKIKNIGLNLKLIIDHFEGIKVIATGSSSFELANQVGEPLVGRKWQFNLYPISQLELKASENRTKTDNKLESRLIYGSYPEVVKADVFKDKQDVLNEIVDSYLYRDLLEFNEIKKSQKIIDILKNVAFQIGQEISLQELGNAVSLNLRTVEKYLALLEKTFVIKRVYGFSRNLRKEITKISRFYFFDNGVRNAVIQNFNTLDLRNDIDESGLHIIEIEASCQSGKIFGFWGGQDLKVEIDSRKFREVPAVGRSQFFNIPVSWNGTKLKGKYKTVFFALKLEKGKHVINFIPKQGAIIKKEPVIKKFISRDIIIKDAQSDDRNHFPWITIALIDLPLHILDVTATCNKRKRDSDDLKLIIDGRNVWDIYENGLDKSKNGTIKLWAILVLLLAGLSTYVYYNQGRVYFKDIDLGEEHVCIDRARLEIGVLDGLRIKKTVIGPINDRSLSSFGTIRDSVVVDYYDLDNDGQDDVLVSSRNFIDREEMYFFRIGEKKLEPIGVRKNKDTRKTCDNKLFSEDILFDGTDEQGRHKFITRDIVDYDNGDQRIFKSYYEFNEAGELAFKKKIIEENLAINN